MHNGFTIGLNYISLEILNKHTLWSLETLNKHTLSKKKHANDNQTCFFNKELSKAIITKIKLGKFENRKIECVTQNKEILVSLF